MPDAARNHAPAAGARNLILIDARLSSRSPRYRADPDKTGAWRVELGDKVDSKRYRMRIDQIGPDGKIVARIELPFHPAGPFGRLLRGAVVFVQPGNGLWRIARRTYGGGVR